MFVVFYLFVWVGKYDNVKRMMESGQCSLKDLDKFFKRFQSIKFWMANFMNRIRKHGSITGGLSYIIKG